MARYVVSAVVILMLFAVLFICIWNGVKAVLPLIKYVLCRIFKIETSETQLADYTRLTQEELEAKLKELAEMNKELAKQWEQYKKRVAEEQKKEEEMWRWRRYWSY